MSRPAWLASPGAVVATAAFTAIAVLRAVQGDLLWAAVFALAAGGYAWLAATRPRREAGRGTARPGGRTSTTTAAAASTEAARRARTWRLLTLSSAALTTGLAVWSEPAIALLGVATTAVAAACWLSARRGSRAAAPHPRTATTRGARP